jgi:predicted Zn-dependent protease
VEGYVQSLGYRLASHSGERRLRFTFFVVDSPVINAFAAPGGFVGINSGLITETESEGELAAVLAHEISHVTQRHIARTLELANRATVPMIAGMIAAILIGTQSPQAGVATAAAVQGKAQQALLDFTRANEQEADRVGMQLLADAELDPRAMPEFFERLQESSRYYAHPPEFLSTHPVTTNRIAESRDRAESYPYRQYEDKLAYHLVRSKLLVRAAKTPAAAVEYFQDLLDSGKFLTPIGARYGYALALLDAHHLDQARAQAAELIKEDPEQVSFHVLLADIEMAAGNLDKALFILEDNLELYPQDRVLTRRYAEALILAGRPRDALDALDAYAKYQPLDADMYKMQAQAHEAIGDRRGAHAALAEHYYHNGQLLMATQQLEIALATAGTGDFYADSKIEARLRQLQDEQALRTEE